MTAPHRRNLDDLTNHPAFSEAYFLLDELRSSATYAVSTTAETLLGQALLELTDHGVHGPVAAQLADVGADLESVYAKLDELLSRLLLDTTGLAISLRLTRVRDLVNEAKRAA